MTKDEWITRCAARYQERAGLTPEQAREAAEACFYAESGEPGFEFSEAVEYQPENCADEDMSYWTAMYTHKQGKGAGEFNGMAKAGDWIGKRIAANGASQADGGSDW